MGYFVIQTYYQATDAEYAPKHFSQIGKIDDIDKRNAWYRAHFTENDGLFEFPDVLRAIPMPPDIIFRARTPPVRHSAPPASQAACCT